MLLLKKIIIMALLGAIGAVIGAVAGEPLFAAPPQTRTEPRQICLLFDVSGSMGDRTSRDYEPGSPSRSITQLEALKDAACDFVDRQDLQLDPMGLAIFSSDAHIVTRLGNNDAKLTRSIRGLSANGGTNLGRGFDIAAKMLRHETGDRWVLVFTDGKPESSSTNETPEAAALSAAARLREAGVNIVAIGTGLADADLLIKATGSRSNVIISDPRKLQDAFRRSEEVINNRQMLASFGQTESFKHNVMITGTWAALIAIGAAVGLVIGQNRHMRRRMLRFGEAVKVLIGGVFIGLLAGAAAQSLFYVLSEMPGVEVSGRVGAWTLLGCGVGFGMGSFVPNLDRLKGTVAGAAGGGVAAVCFLTLVPIVGDTIGRLLAAAILGLSTGIMVALVEAVSRKAYLVIHWSANEQSSLTLGSNPILVGCTGAAHVLIPDDDCPVPIVARIRIAEKAVPVLEDQHGTRSLSHGETLTYGHTRIEVRAEYLEADRQAA